MEYRGALYRAQNNITEDSFKGSVIDYFIYV